MGASGSINYSLSSGSYYSSAATPLFPSHDAGSVPHGILNFQKPPTTTTITEELTIKYYQRVYDAGLSVYCYYTKTSIDATPLSTETSPEYTGAISDHSVVKILEIY